MSNTRIVLAQGPIDGVNTVFGTGVAYRPGSTAYILNGRIHNQALARGPDNSYGFVELDAAGGTIQVDVPPDIDDVVQILFDDRRVVPAPPITRLVGVVKMGADDHARLVGVVREPAVTRLVGVVSTSTLTGVVRNPDDARLAGVIPRQRIVGMIKERC